MDSLSVRSRVRLVRRNSCQPVISPATRSGQRWTTRPVETGCTPLLFAHRGYTASSDEYHDVDQILTGAPSYIASSMICRIFSPDSGVRGPIMTVDADVVEILGALPGSVALPPLRHHAWADRYRFYRYVCLVLNCECVCGPSEPP
jgi:hypothetical protein